MSNFFKVTPQAAEQIIIATQQGAAVQEPTLRIAARTLPDGSVDYSMGFDEQREFDFEVAVHGISILIGPSSRDLLEGVTLDFVEMEPGQFHFIFIPPSDKPQATRQSNAGKDIA